MNYAKGHAEAFVLNTPASDDSEYLRGWADGLKKRDEEYRSFQYNADLVRVEEDEGPDDGDYDDYDYDDYGDDDVDYL